MPIVRRVPKRQQRSGSSIYGHRWAMYSRQYRNEHPLCVACGRLAHHVDHITPISGPNDPLFWDTGNHQSLCRSCHSKKTVKENGR